MASPLALLGAVPLAPAPALLRDRVMASVEAGAAPPPGAGGGAGTGGPVAATGSRRRRNVLVGAAAATVAAVVALVAVLAGALASGGDGGTDVLAAEVDASPTTGEVTTTVGSAAAPAPSTTGSTTTEPAAPTTVTTVVPTVTVPPSVTVPPVETTVAPPPPPPAPGQLEWSTDVIDVGDAGTSGGLVLSNTGGSPVTWQAAGGPSAAVQPAGGTLAPGSSVAATVVVDRSSLAEGPFALPLAVSSDGGSTTVDVIGSVAEPPELIRVTRSVGDVAVAAPRCLGTTTSRVVVSAEDDSGIGGGTLSWSHSNGASGTTAFTVEGGGLVARLGPFGAEGAVTWSVAVRDTFGNVTTQAGSPALPVVCETGGLTIGGGFTTG
ncbi:MAG: hypothetical protein S0880_30660, partial [Actinomycetota bacterium]|nr:hypothetical protein [Actinomycetota bacterium]